MAFKKTGKKPIKIICATAMCIFSLFSVFMATFAWFVSKSNLDLNNNNLKINNTKAVITDVTIHEFLGDLDDEGGHRWAFNTVPTQTISFVGSDSSSSSESEAEIFMGTFSLNDPHHPVLILLQVNNESREQIRAVTSIPYLASTNTPTVTVATYDQLASSYADNTIIQVTTDSNYYNKTTYYKYTSANGFELVQIPLMEDNNPLSSVIESHYFKFAYNPKTNNTETGTFVIEGESETQTFIPLDYATCTSTSNRGSFVSFTNGNPTFSKEAYFFDGDTAGAAYIGLVIDYNLSSLEYIFSYYLGHQYLNNGLGFMCDWTLDV